MCALSVIATQPRTPLQCGAMPLDQLEEGQVEEHVLVLGMIDDVADLLGEQARIDGVTHGAAARGGVVDLEMAEAVPGQRADAIRRPHPERAERVGELARAPVCVPVGVAVDAALDHARDDLGVPVVALGVTDQRRDLQGHVHHQAVHGTSSARFVVRVHRRQILAGRGRAPAPRFLLESGHGSVYRRRRGAPPRPEHRMNAQ